MSLTHMPSDPLISPSPSFIEVLKCYGPDLLAVANSSLKVPAALELGIALFEEGFDAFAHVLAGVRNHNREGGVGERVLER